MMSEHGGKNNHMYDDKKRWCDLLKIDDIVSAAVARQLQKFNTLLERNTCTSVADVKNTTNTGNNDQPGSSQFSGISKNANFSEGIINKSRTSSFNKHINILRSYETLENLEELNPDYMKKSVNQNFENEHTQESRNESPRTSAPTQNRISFLVQKYQALSKENEKIGTKTLGSVKKVVKDFHDRKKKVDKKERKVSFEEDEIEGKDRKENTIDSNIAMEKNEHFQTKHEDYERRDKTWEHKTSMKNLDESTSVKRKITELVKSRADDACRNSGAFSCHSRQISAGNHTDVTRCSRTVVLSRNKTSGKQHVISPKANIPNNDEYNRKLTQKSVFSNHDVNLKLDVGNRGAIQECENKKFEQRMKNGTAKVSVYLDALEKGPTSLNISGSPALKRRRHRSLPNLEVIRKKNEEAKTSSGVGHNNNNKHFIEQELSSNMNNGTWEKPQTTNMFGKAFCADLSFIIDKVGSEKATEGEPADIYRHAKFNTLINNVRQKNRMEEMMNRYKYSLICDKDSAKEKLRARKKASPRSTPLVVSPRDRQTNSDIPSLTKNGVFVERCAESRLTRSVSLDNIHSKPTNNSFESTSQRIRRLSSSLDTLVDKVSNISRKSLQQYENSGENRAKFVHFTRNSTLASLRNRPWKSMENLSTPAFCQHLDQAQRNEVNGEKIPTKKSSTPCNMAVSVKDFQNETEGIISEKLQRNRAKKTSVTAAEKSTFEKVTAAVEQHVFCEKVKKQDVMEDNTKIFENKQFDVEHRNNNCCFHPSNMDKNSEADSVQTNDQVSSAMSINGGSEDIVETKDDFVAEQSSHKIFSKETFNGDFGEEKYLERNLPDGRSKKDNVLMINDKGILYEKANSFHHHHRTQLSEDNSNKRRRQRNMGFSNAYFIFPKEIAEEEQASSRHCLSEINIDMVKNKQYSKKAETELNFDKDRLIASKTLQCNELDVVAHTTPYCHSDTTLQDRISYLTSVEKKRVDDKSSCTYSLSSQNRKLEKQTPESVIKTTRLFDDKTPNYTGRLLINATLESPVGDVGNETNEAVGKIAENNNNNTGTNRRRKCGVFESPVEKFTGHSLDFEILDIPNANQHFDISNDKFGMENDNRTTEENISNCNSRVLEKVLQVVHNEFAFGSYLNDGVEDVNMAEFIISHGRKSEDDLKEAVRKEYKDLYWKDKLVSVMYNIVQQGLHQDITLSEMDTNNAGLHERSISSDEGISTSSPTLSFDFSEVAQFDFNEMADIKDDLTSLFNDYHCNIGVFLATTVNALVEKLPIKIKEVQQQINLEKRQKRRSWTAYLKLINNNVDLGTKETKDLDIKLRCDLEEMQWKISYLKNMKRKLENIYCERFGLDCCFLKSFIESFSVNTPLLSSSNENEHLTFYPVWCQYRGIYGPDDIYESKQGLDLQHASQYGLLAYLFARYAMVQGYVKCFFFSYRYFITSCQLLEYICEKYDASTSLDESKKQTTHQVQIQNRALDLLTKWMEDFYEVDFQNNTRLLKNLKDFLEQQVVKTDKSDKGKYLLNILSEKQSATKLQFTKFRLHTSLEDLSNFNENIEFSQYHSDLNKTNVKPRITSRASLPQLYYDCESCVLDYTDQMIAEQLSLIQQDIFHRVHPVHFLNTRSLGIGIARKQTANIIASHKDILLGFSAGARRGSCDNVDVSPDIPATLAQDIDNEIIEEIIEHAQNISMWIAAEICGMSSIKTQLALITKFVNVAQFCQEIRNFETTIQILDALETFVVRQLPVWKQVSTKTFETLDKLKAIKVLLKTDPCWLIQNDIFRRKPTLPSVLLFIMHVQQEEIGGLLIANGMYKWTKLRSIAKLVEQIYAFQELKYNFPRNSDVQSLIKRCIVNLKDQNLHLIASENCVNFHNPRPSTNSKKLKNALEKMKSSFI